MDKTTIELDTSKVQENPNAIGMGEMTTPKLQDENQTPSLVDREKKKISRGKEKMGSKQRKSIKLKENVDEVVAPSPKKKIDNVADENDRIKKKILELTFSRDTGELVSKMDQEYVEELKAAFEHADINDSGNIQTSELVILLKNLGVNVADTEMQDIVNEFDFNGTGAIDFNEFLQFMARRDEWRCEEDIKIAFSVFDPDNEGFIDVQELREIMQRDEENLTEKEIKEILSVVDQDGNGRVEYSEFVQLMLNDHDEGG
ncbi:uncharacterized protein [Clytia hemisphaerica]|eukprot:TCONS_00004098-protein